MKEDDCTKKDVFDSSHTNRQGKYPISVINTINTCASPGLSGGNCCQTDDDQDEPQAR